MSAAASPPSKRARKKGAKHKGQEDQSSGQDGNYSPARLRILVALAGALVASLGGIAWALWIQAEPFDDAYISLRSAAHLAQGFGPVFNIGERVESASSPLWTALLALLIRSGLDPLPALDLLARFSLACAGAFSGLLAYELGGVIAGFSCPLLLMLMPSFGAWSCSGMETLLAAAMLSAALLLALRARSRVAALASGLVAALMALTRPEAMALIPLFALALPDLRKQLVPYALAAGLPLAALFLARHAYFGEWLPNTYIAKVSGGGAALHLRGAIYAGSLLSIHAPLVLLASIAAFRAFRTTHSKTTHSNASDSGVTHSATHPSTHSILSPIAVAWLACAVLMASIAWDGGDHFPLWRMAVPALPLALAACSPLFSSRAIGKVQRVLVIALILGTAVAEGGFDSSARSFHGVPNLSRMRVERKVAADARAVGVALRELPRGRLAAVAIGAVGYYSDWPILDLVGITDATIARSPHIPGAASGHDHADTRYVLEQAPDYVLLVPQLTPIEIDGDREEIWLHAAHRHYAAAIELLNSRKFQQGWAPQDLKPAPGEHLRLWIRRDLPLPASATPGK